MMEEEENPMNEKFSYSQFIAPCRLMQSQECNLSISHNCFLRCEVIEKVNGSRSTKNFIKNFSLFFFFLRQALVKGKRRQQSIVRLHWLSGRRGEMEERDNWSGDDV
jgi:hypothetical protein